MTREELRQAALAYRPTRLQTAIHESGHAAAQLALGVPFSRVVLAGDGVDLGHDRYSDGPVRGQVEGELRCSLFVGAVILWAGPLAEGTAYAAGTDLAKIKVLGAGWVADRSATSPWWAALQLVTSRKAAIAGLAELLVERGELSYDECAQVSEEILALTAG